MRLVFVGGFFLHYSVELINRLAQKNDILFLARTDTHELGGENAARAFLKNSLDPRIKLEFFRFGSELKRQGVKTLRHMHRQITDFSPDVIHLQETGDWRYLTLLKHKSTNAKIVTVHDVYRHYGEPAERRHRRLVRRLSRAWADGLIVHGPIMRRQLLSQGIPASKVFLSKIGAFSAYTTAPNGSSSEKQGPTILFFGRIWPYKGLRYLIEAVPQVASVVKDVRIIIAGRGEPLEPYLKLIKNRDCFEIHNSYISTEQAADFFHKADVIVLPYVEASQSGVAPVALAMGKPVIASWAGDLPHVIENNKNGLLIPPANSRALAKALIAVLTDSTYRLKLGDQASLYAKNCLSWQLIADRSEQIYRRVLATKAGAKTEQ